MVGFIMTFEGAYAFLSNFFPSTVTMDGVRYPTIENAYQAAKAPSAQRLAFRSCPPGKAKRLGRAVLLPEDWDQRKVNVMRGLIQQKFEFDSTLAERLLLTKNAMLVEANTWGDTFWGVCRGQGENMLGRLLMEQRDLLRKQRKRNDR